MKSKSWLLRFAAIVLAALAALAALAYAVDPYMHYRVRDNCYLLNSRFVDSGIIKNADYDAVVVGSSVTQNFDMQLFRERLGVRPIKITTGAISLSEIEQMSALVNESGKARYYFICLDQYLFTPEGDSGGSRFPAYLTDSSGWNDFRYLLGYETWLRFIPVDAAFLALRAAGMQLPVNYQYATSIDRLEDWSLNKTFGAEQTLSSYQRLPAGTEPVSTEGLLESMMRRFDQYLSTLELSQGHYRFFFPPYSSLYWRQAVENGCFDDYMAFKTYAAARLCVYDNVEVYDFQGADFTCDLDNYCDAMHYSPEINDWMVDCFAHGSFTVREDGEERIRMQIEDNLHTLTERYPQLTTN